ncbi:MAG: metabolite traffic protein EboE, partial [Planctomycetota bacterium]
SAGGDEILLTYCSNVHPGETLEQIQQNIEQTTVAVKKRLFTDQQMGLGLWLPRGALDELRGEKAMSAFRTFLERHGMYVFTLNAFPYSGFHGPRVKEAVFRPSWAEQSRLEYTRLSGEVLADLLPAGVTGSISTVPLGHRAAGFRPQHEEAAAVNLRRLAVEFRRIEERTGRALVLGLEPEPTAALDTVRSAVEFLEGSVFQGRDDPSRRQLGICFDACHEAVLYQDLTESLDQARRAGVRIAKIQVTSALELVNPGAQRAALDRLRSFDEGRYYHQVVTKGADGSTRVFQDLDRFFQRWECRDIGGDPSSLRTHFHVPVFAGSLDGLGTTQGELERFLRHAVAAGVTSHYEVETYTFGVIPEAERSRLGADDLAQALTRELEWTLERLAVPGQGR